MLVFLGISLLCIMHNIDLKYFADVKNDNFAGMKNDWAVFP